jgi:hypothetical protein
MMFCFAALNGSYFGRDPYHAAGFEARQIVDIKMTPSFQNIEQRYLRTAKANGEWLQKINKKELIAKH